MPNKVHTFVSEYGRCVSCVYAKLHHSFALFNHVHISILGEKMHVVKKLFTLVNHLECRKNNRKTQNLALLLPMATFKCAAL